MNGSLRRTPWSLAGGAGIVVGGLALLVAVLFGAPPLWLPAAALVLAAVVELSAGASLQRHRGAGIAHILGGGIGLAFALFIAASVVIDPRAAAASPIALVLGVYYLVNAIFRGLDLAIDRPQARLTEGVDAAVTLILAVVLLSRWQGATAALIAVAAGIDLVVRGLSLAGSARWIGHPEVTPYHGHLERLGTTAAEEGHRVNT